MRVHVELRAVTTRAEAPFCRLERAQKHSAWSIHRRGFILLFGFWKNKCKSSTLAVDKWYFDRYYLTLLVPAP